MGHEEDGAGAKEFWGRAQQGTDDSGAVSTRGWGLKTMQTQNYTTPLLVVGIQSLQLYEKLKHTKGWPYFPLGVILVELHLGGPASIGVYQVNISLPKDYFINDMTYSKLYMNTSNCNL